MKSDILRKFIENYKKRQKKKEAWVDKLPSSISGAFFDNEYQIHTEFQVELAMELALHDWYDDVNWFLYEWKAGDKVWTADDKEYTINNLDDYIAYLKAEGALDE